MYYSVLGFIIWTLLSAWLCVSCPTQSWRQWSHWKSFTTASGNWGNFFSFFVASLKYEMDLSRHSVCFISSNIVNAFCLDKCLSASQLPKNRSHIVCQHHSSKLKWDKAQTVNKWKGFFHSHENSASRNKSVNVWNAFQHFFMIWNKE